MKHLILIRSLIVPHEITHEAARIHRRIERRQLPYRHPLECPRLFHRRWHKSPSIGSRNQDLHGPPSTTCVKNHKTGLGVVHDREVHWRPDASHSENIDDRHRPWGDASRIGSCHVR